MKAHQLNELLLIIPYLSKFYYQNKKLLNYILYFNKPQTKRILVSIFSFCIGNPIRMILVKSPLTGLWTYIIFEILSEKEG